MRKTDLRMNELNKYEIIKNLVEKNGNTLRVDEKLGCNIRAIYQWIEPYNKDGKYGFIHSNKNKATTTFIDPIIKNEIILLYTNKHKKFNISHFKDTLKEKKNIPIS